MQLHLELHQSYLEKAAELNGENLGAYKPGQYQHSEENLKPGSSFSNIG